MQASRLPALKTPILTDFASYASPSGRTMIVDKKIGMGVLALKTIKFQVPKLKFQEPVEAGNSSN